MRRPELAVNLAFLTLVGCAVAAVLLGQGLMVLTLMVLGAGLAVSGGLVLVVSRSMCRRRGSSAS